jgi:predicted nucleic acid-binding protein
VRASTHASGGAWRTGAILERRARQALGDLLALPLRRAPHGPLLPRIWALRDNVTGYGAAYVALAEALEAPLVTADARISRAPGVRRTVDVLS